MLILLSNRQQDESLFVFINYFMQKISIETIFFIVSISIHNPNSFYLQYEKITPVTRMSFFIIKKKLFFG